MPKKNDEKEDRKRIEGFIESLVAGLPPVIARRDARKLTGGIISPNTLKNEDAAGTGPEESYRIGKKTVCYPTRALLTWLVERYGVAVISNVKPEKGASE